VPVWVLGLLALAALGELCSLDARVTELEARAGAAEDATDDDWREPDDD
jgi:hypothetical protein